MATAWRNQWVLVSSIPRPAHTPGAPPPAPAIVVRPPLGCLTLQKHLATRRGPPTFEIFGQRLSDIDRERQPIEGSALPTDGHFARGATFDVRARQCRQSPCPGARGGSAR